MVYLKIIITVVIFISMVKIQFSQEVKFDSSTNSTYSLLTSFQASSELFSSFDMTGYQLLSTNLRIDKQKVVFSPFKLLKGYLEILSEMQFNIAQEKDITTTGLSLSYNSTSPRSVRARKILKGLNTVSERTQGVNETKEEYELYRKLYKEVHLEGLYSSFYEELAKNSVIITIGTNLQSFKILGGDRIDLDSNGKTDNYYKVKTWEVGIDFSYSYKQKFGLDLSYHFLKKRATSVEGEELIPYHGFIVSLGHRILILDDNYKNSQEYKDNIFIPALIGGLTFEYLDCIVENKKIEDNIKRQIALTPFLDFKISSKNQFRLGVPIKFLTYVDKTNSVQLGSVLQYSLQLSSLVK